MNRALVLAGIAAGTAWLGVAEIIDRNFFLGVNTLLIVVICLLVATEDAPPRVRSDTPLPSEKRTKLAATGRAASQQPER